MEQGSIIGRTNTKLLFNTIFPSSFSFRKLHNLADTSEDYISHKYRSSFVYNNWMVSLAGYITELLTNQTYEAGIIEKYYIPLELDNATFANLQWYNRSKTALPAYRVVDYSAPPQNFSWLPLSVDFLRFV